MNMLGSFAVFSDIAKSDAATPRHNPQLRKYVWWLCWICLVLPSLCAGSPSSPISYEVDLRAPASHLVKVGMVIPDARAGTEIQFPAWNALYQMRDFVRGVQGLTASCDGEPTRLARLDLYTWGAGQKACVELVIRYSVYANEEGVFSSAFNEQHAYLNLAMVLFYLPLERRRPVRVKYILPEDWKLATLLDDTGVAGEFNATDYDALVDSPAEASQFREYAYEQKGARYRVIVHTAAGGYDGGRLISSIKKITEAATDLMHDVPFTRYTFLLHFPHSGGGGMEHRDGTAISVAADELKSNWLGVESVIAHEFFHVWNVKRIRPQNLEPVDYVRGNDTRDLWFAEGVTSTFQEYILLRAGLLSRDAFYARLANEIARLQDRPARNTQSLENAGREAWLEKYPDYLRPDRSISYYNKGALVGFLLDLAIRQQSHSQFSLTDVMRRLNSEFAKRGRFLAKEDLVQIIEDFVPMKGAAEAFFDAYVSGTRELDYDNYLAFAGLRLEKKSTPAPALGFVAVRNLNRPVTVESLEPESNAERAGLRADDVLLEMNDRILESVPDDLLHGMKPGQEVQFRVRRDGREFNLKYSMEAKTRTLYSVEEAKSADPEQRRLREFWLNGTTVTAAGAGKR